MPQSVTYRFFAAGNERVQVDLRFDEQTFRLIIPADGARPEWARLEFQKCSNCPLTGQEYCPAALALAQFLPHFATRVSYEKAVVEVETALRTIVSKTTLQYGIAGLIGLAMATSGCPHTYFLRPMARTHLPFATEQETVLRALAFHLLGQYVENKNNGTNAPLSLERLKNDYGNLSVVNAAMAERVRCAIKLDAAVNAIIILDSFALIAPENIDGDFDDIRHFFLTE
jgi:hypothetical protein